jgi:hypothetical protein
MKEMTLIIYIVKKRKKGKLSAVLPSALRS